MKPELQEWQDRFERGTYVAGPGLTGLTEGQVVETWKCPSCDLYELSTFLLRLNHGYDPEVPGSQPYAGWGTPCSRQTLLASQERARQQRWARRVQACIAALARVRMGHAPGLAVYAEPQPGVFLTGFNGHVAVVFDDAPITSRTKATGALWWRDSANRPPRLVGQLHRGLGQDEDGFTPLVPEGAFEAARRIAAEVSPFGVNPEESAGGVDGDAPPLYALSRQGERLPAGHEEQIVTSKSRANRNAEKNVAAAAPSPKVWIVADAKTEEQLAGPFETEAEAIAARDDVAEMHQVECTAVEVPREAAEPDRLLEQELQPGEAIQDQPAKVTPSDEAPVQVQLPEAQQVVVLRFNTADRALAYSTLARFGYQAFDRWGELVSPADWNSGGNRRATVELNGVQARQLAAALSNHSAWMAKQGDVAGELAERKAAVVHLAERVRDARTAALA